MKRTVILLTTLLISITAFSQDRSQSQERRSPDAREQRSPEEFAKRYVDRLSEDLDLTAEQKDKVYQLSIEQSKLRRDRTEMTRENMEEMQKNREEYQSKIEGILTPEQLQKWNKSREEAIKNRRGEFRRGPAMRSNDTTRTDRVRRR